jgi:putative ABC transport system ATP-binding protein
MVKLKNIKKNFNSGTVNENKVFSNLSLEIRNNDFITIIGSNGAGKTTLFNLLSGNTSPNSGEIYINKKNVTRDPEYKRAGYIGRIFQNPLAGTAANMSIEDNMMICSKKGFKGLKISLNQKKRDFFKEQLRQLEMGLEDRLKDNTGLLSGGQRQALTLLMMVLSKPDLVLLDEHTAALDPNNAQLVLDLTCKFIDMHNLTALMITHNMKNAIEYGNRLLMMDGGDIVIDVSGDEKKKLTVKKLITMFNEIRKVDFANDEVLLTSK